VPELPEVETIVRGLQKKVQGRTFINVWTDFPKTIKLPGNFQKFKQEIKGRKVERVWRRGKNILFDLSGGKILLIHQKLTGHLLFGKWELKKGKWQSQIKGPLTEDPMNRFLHLIFWLDNQKQLALSDLRKFAKVELWEREALKQSQGFNDLGPEPLKKNFTLKKFKEVLRKKQGKIKEILMDQKVLVGIGNIYSSEILWKAKINPFKGVLKLTEKEIKEIYLALKEILKKAVKLRGESFSDFRDIDGYRGSFDQYRKVYRRENEKCRRCGNKIKRLKVKGRSAYFCPKCQK
tara:strand:+ start:12694 stop:13569 length:876 start_codon:yes stop_codon:yes gene_type:complete